MGKVYTQASVSLDGYISGPGQTGFDKLFAWCTAGPVVTPSEDPERLMLPEPGDAASVDFAQAEVIEGIGVTHLVYRCGAGGN
jgi:hypothetical protein